MRIDSQKDLSTWASLRHIDVHIDQKKILSDINLNLNYGDNIVILGPNGSGKSTFLKLLNRSIYPIISKDSSLKLFNKENISIWEVRRKIGFLFKEMEDRVKNDVILFLNNSVFPTKFIVLGNITASIAGSKLAVWLETIKTEPFLGILCFPSTVTLAKSL